MGAGDFQAMVNLTDNVNKNYEEHQRTKKHPARNHKAPPAAFNEPAVFAHFKPREKIHCLAKVCNAYFYLFLLQKVNLRPYSLRKM